MPRTRYFHRRQNIFLLFDRVHLALFYDVGTPLSPPSPGICPAEMQSPGLPVPRKKQRAFRVVPLLQPFKIPVQWRKLLFLPLQRSSKRYCPVILSLLTVMQVNHCLKNIQVADLYCPSSSIPLLIHPLQVPLPAQETVLT